jgi:hypothetical protein
MKNHIVRNLLIGLMLCAALGLMAFSPFQENPPQTGAGPLTVPDAIQGALFIGVVFLLTAGIKAISKHVALIPTLDGQITVIAGGIVTAVVAITNALLAQVPPEYVPLTYSILGAIVAFLGANGIAGMLSNSKKTDIAK